MTDMVPLVHDQRQAHIPLYCRLKIAKEKKKNSYKNEISTLKEIQQQYITH